MLKLILQIFLLSVPMALRGFSPETMQTITTPTEQMDSDTLMRKWQAARRVLWRGGSEADVLKAYEEA